jgi:hypothetical protein
MSVLRRKGSSDRCPRAILPFSEEVDAMPAGTETAWNGLRLFVEEAGTLEQPEDRVRAVLGVSDGPLPEVGHDSLQSYYEYLRTHLFFPFQARYPEPIGLHEEIIRTVRVVGLLDPTKNLDCESLGIVCKARQGKQMVELSLADLEVEEADPNHQLVEDYWYWFWNWR